MEELKMGKYKVPEGCVAVLNDGVLTIRKNLRGTGRAQCKNCAHYGYGPSLAHAPQFSTTVCKNRRKGSAWRDGVEIPVYYHVGAHNDKCKDFIRKEANDD